MSFKNFIAFYLLYAVLIIIEIVFVPLYLKQMWPKKNWRSLGLKMICATAYMLMGIIATLYRAEVSDFAALMLTGLALSWLGDLLLHIPKGNGKLFFLLGLVSFMTAHFFFIAAFAKAQTAFIPGSKPLAVWEFIAALSIAAVFIVVCCIRGVKYEAFIVPACLYASAVSMMMVKALSLGVQLWQAGIDNRLAAVALLFVGGLCFVQSDASLALISFDTRFKMFKLKVYNIVTYFAAQVCLASTIFFLN